MSTGKCAAAAELAREGWLAQPALPISQKLDKDTEGRGPFPFLPYEPGQSFLLPPSPMEWLPEDHFAYFVLEVVGRLELGSLYSYYDREERGQCPHDPRMMVALLLYGYSVGVASSRKIERKTYTAKRHHLCPRKIR